MKLKRFKRRDLMCVQFVIYFTLFHISGMCLNKEKKEYHQVAKRERKNIHACKQLYLSKFWVAL